MARVSNDGLSSPTLADGVGYLWWFSGNGEDTYGVVVLVEALGAVGLARAARN
jgi:hypothetical protein